MSKYIIEIPDDVQYVLLNGQTDNKCYTAVRPVAELEVLNSDYINEHYGELQDEAYLKGFKDGKKPTGKGCDGCEYENQKEGASPCCECARVCDDHYIPKRSDRIEVGDEVKAPFGTAVVTHLEEDGVGYLYSTGRTGFDIPRNLIKTGKHYDIASILEAMRK